MTNVDPAASSPGQEMDALRHPSYWGLTDSAQFELTRSSGSRTEQADKPVPIAIVLEFLEQACGVNLAAQEALVAAILSGVPFEIDDATMVFKLIDGASDDAASREAMRPESK